MKNLKYIILSLFISTSAIAQQPSLPELGLPDLTEDSENKPAEIPAVSVTDEAKPKIPPLPNAPTLAPAEASPTNKKILDKAINEVFGEVPAENPQAVAPATPAVITPEVSAPALPDVAKESGVKVIEVSPDQPLIEKTDVPAQNPEPEAVIQPEETTSPIVEETEAKTEEKKVEDVVEVKKAEPVAKKVKKSQPKAKPAVKKVEVPKQVPKSLRQDYLNHIGQNIAAEPQQMPALPAQQQIKENINYQDLPENTRPIMLNRNIWQNKSLPTDEANKVELASKVEEKEIEKIQLPKKQIAELFKPKSLQEKNNPPVSLAENLYKKTSDRLSEAKKKSNPELDLLKDKPLPEKEEKLEVKSDIKIEAGNFTDPFPAIAPATSELDALVEAPIQPEQTGDSDGQMSPVVDFSEQPIENIDEVAQQPIGDIYTQDLGLQVEVKEAPKSSVSNMKNAFEALQVGQYESAIEYYQEILAANPKNGKARFGLATAYHKSKQYEKAKKEYVEIINQSPDFWPAVNNYILLVTEENPSKSKENLEDLYRKNPNFSAIPAQLGSLYYNKNDLQKSAKYYIEAVKLEPQNVDYRYNLAVILEKAGNFKDAAEVYRSLLEDASMGKKLPENPVVIRDRYDMLTAKARG